MKEYTDIQIRSGDMTITVEGEHEIFGGVDLQVEAITTMIRMLDFKFASDHVGSEYSQKAHVKLLNALGQSMKNTGFYPDEAPNLPVVQSFVNWFIDESGLMDNPEYEKLLDEDEEEY